MRCEPFVITYLMWLPCPHVVLQCIHWEGKWLDMDKYHSGSPHHTAETKLLRSSQPNNNNQRHLCVRKEEGQCWEQPLHMELIMSGVEALDRLTDD